VPLLPALILAHRMMTSIQEELTDDPTTSELIATPHGELSRHIPVVRCLLGSKSHYAALGNDYGHMDAAPHRDVHHEATDKSAARALLVQSH